MAQAAQKSTAVGRTCRKCRKRCSRNCKIVTSPSKLAKIAFEFLDGWVTRRTVVTFVMLEALASIGAVLFFCAIREISELGLVIKSLFFYPFIMFIRLLSSGLGFFAGFFRKVTLTKFYFALLSFNIPMTFFVCIPLWRCSCICDRHEFLAINKDSKLKDPDCKVLQQFVSTPTQTTARLLLEGEPAPRSHAMAVANAVADTVGAAATSSSTLRSWQMAIAHALLQFRNFFSTVSEPARSPSPRRSSGRRHRLLRDRVLANASQQRRSAAVVKPDAGGEQRRGRASSAHRRLKMQYPILYYFDVTEDGIGWKSDGDIDCGDALAELPKDTLRSKLQQIRTWALDGEGTVFKKHCSSFWCETLAMQLENCVEDEQCGAVQARALTKKVDSAPDMDGIVSEEDEDILRTCQYSLPIFPTLLSEENKTGNMFFQKKETVTMKSMMLNQFEEDSAADKCYALVTLVMMSLLLLDIISVPMFIIVQKFLMRRCGDFLNRERQFTVEFSSEEEDSEDDFTIGSRTWMSGSQSRQGSRIASSFQSMAEGDASFSPPRPGSPGKASRKAMPEHWKGAPQTGLVELADTSGNRAEAACEKHARVADEERSSVVIQMDSTTTIDDRGNSSQAVAPKKSAKPGGGGITSMYSWG